MLSPKGSSSHTLWVLKSDLCRSVMISSSNQDNMTCVFYTVKLILDCNHFRGKTQTPNFSRSMAFSHLLDPFVRIFRLTGLEWNLNDRINFLEQIFILARQKSTFM